MTTRAHDAPTAQLLSALELLTDLLRRAEQFERICYEELHDLEDPELDLLATRRALTIFRADLDRIGGQCMTRGLLGPDGEVTRGKGRRKATA